MDRFVCSLRAEPEGDLMVCPDFGVAYQADRSHRVNYDRAYFDKCASYEGNEIAAEVTRGRVKFVADHFGWATMVDVGIGGGEFLKARPGTFGHDVNPVAIEWLKRNDRWAGSLLDFRAFSFWDVLEHIDEPEIYFHQILLGSFVFASLPIFAALDDIRESKHYRPGEHLYYWTQAGFVEWMDAYGFRLLESRDFETVAGRDSIRDFAFRRYRWPNK